LIPTGILGGSFNPAHRGHRGISLLALRELALDEVWWLVSPGNPLKSDDGMAPFAARLASARDIARHAPIRATGIEARLGSRYTADTLRVLVRRYPHRRFVWLMGADNLAQFHRWREWRTIARTLPIAVIARPGYDDDALRAPAMGWLRRFVRPANLSARWTNWRPPAVVLLRSMPDPRSATALRARDPDWHRAFAGRPARDALTRRAITAAPPR
jgi:nicotinate-nucleotide adenylyltransferase